MTPLYNYRELQKCNGSFPHPRTIDRERRGVGPKLFVAALFPRQATEKSMPQPEHPGAISVSRCLRVSMNWTTVSSSTFRRSYNPTGIQDIAIPDRSQAKQRGDMIRSVARWTTHGRAIGIARHVCGTVRLSPPVPAGSSLRRGCPPTAPCSSAPPS
jgi:hypothetical protein